MCGSPADESHHVVSGSANRKKSEYWGLKADLCRNCHNLVHADYSARVLLCQKYQKIFEEQYSRELWMQEFGRSYL